MAPTQNPPKGLICTGSSRFSNSLTQHSAEHKIASSPSNVWVREEYSTLKLTIFDLLHLQI